MGLSLPLPPTAYLPLAHGGCPRRPRALALCISADQIGIREDWIRGIAAKVKPNLHRSIEQEMTLNAGGKYVPEYEYVVHQPATERMTSHVDASGRPIVYDEGHDGMVLADFVAAARERWAKEVDFGAISGECTLTPVDIAVMRLYTGSLYTPWNNALRGIDEDGNEDNGSGLHDWATCIAVLSDAIIKWSNVAPCDEHGARQTVATVYRGVREETRKLPHRFYEKCPENRNYPGGVDLAFQSTTTDPWT